VKTVIWAGRTFHYGPGQAFALPEGAYVDVVNEPDPKTGMYWAFHLGFSSGLLEMARRNWSKLAANAVARDPTVEMTSALCSAVLHTSQALAGEGGASARVIDHRLLEVLLILAEAGAAPLRPDIRTCSMTDAVRAVIRQAPGRPWEVTDVARQLRTTDPTLRRNLRQEGASFRQILAGERMRAALTELGFFSSPIFDGGAPQRGRMGAKIGGGLPLFRLARNKSGQGGREGVVRVNLVTRVTFRPYRT